MKQIFLNSGTYTYKPLTGKLDMEKYILSVLEKDTCCTKTLFADSATITTLTTTTFSTSGVFSLANGTVLLPSLSFTSDPDTGLYRIGANNAGFSAAGAKVLDISATGLGVVGTVLNGNGAVGAPAFSYTSDPDSGWYRIGANNIGAAVNGANVLDVATTGLTITGTTIFSGINNYKSTTSMTALAGGAQAGTALVSEYNEFTTVATAADSAQLPVGVLGKKVIVKNSAAKSMAVFGQTGAAIDGAASNAAFAVQPGQEVIFEAISATVWNSMQGTSLGTISSVTQGTNITTGVTVNSKKGIITTFTPSTAGLAATTFTVTCNKTTATSNIRAYVTEYGGTVITNGLPYVFVKNQTASSFDIVIYNAHATNALATSLKIGFEIIN